MKCLMNCKNEFNNLPNKKNIINIIKLFRHILFIGYFDEVCIEKEEYIKLKTENITSLLKEEINKSFITANKQVNNIDSIIDEIYTQIDKVSDMLKSDLEFYYNSDPACIDYNEIILTYPGYFAIFIHRIANIFYKLNIPYIPRILSEYSHEKTGIDIHPGATIEKSFFIDHGTGVVIGETTTIGEFVKIYQGVTLGALSLSRGQALKGEKRHPSILNNVTIYSGVSILGGDTVVGNNTTIGSNVIVTSSIPDNSIVFFEEPKINIIERKK
ncbi:MAG: serine O-acetyltransferase EpsC [Anaeroplasmataceae bacterium]